MPRGNPANSQMTKATLGLRELCSTEPSSRASAFPSFGWSRSSASRGHRSESSHDARARRASRRSLAAASSYASSPDRHRRRDRAPRSPRRHGRTPCRGTAGVGGRARAPARALSGAGRDRARPEPGDVHRVLRLNEEFHRAFRELAKSPSSGGRSSTCSRSRSPDRALPLMVHAAPRVVGDPARRATPAPRAHRRDRPARGSACRVDRARACTDRPPEPRRRAREPTSSSGFRGDLAAAPGCCLLTTPTQAEPNQVNRHTSIDVRPMLAEDLDAADRVMRLAFGTIRGLPIRAAFGDSDAVRTRFRAAPECAWVAEVDGDVVGSVFAAAGARSASSARSPSSPASGITASAARCSGRCSRHSNAEVRQAGPLHVRGEPQAPRPVPEARLLARI